VEKVGEVREEGVEDSSGSNVVKNRSKKSDRGREEDSVEEEQRSLLESRARTSVAEDKGSRAKRSKLLDERKCSVPGKRLSKEAMGLAFPRGWKRKSN